jgi:serine/threonine protein kinase
MPDRGADDTGRVLFAGKFHILDVLGRGGMGIVYLAEDVTLKRRIALKLLPPDFVRDAEARTRFLREAQAAAALDHPNICTDNPTWPWPSSRGRRSRRRSPSGH